MRWHIKAALSVSATLLLTGVAQAQGGGFFPGGRGGPGADPAAILRNPSVKKERKLEDEQLAKLPAAQLKAVAEILTPQQLTRFKQISLQLKGPAAFLEPDVQKELKLSPEQVTARLQEAGASEVQVEVTEPSLEDVFLAVVGKSAKEQAA